MMAALVKDHRLDFARRQVALLVLRISGNFIF